MGMIVRTSIDAGANWSDGVHVYDGPSAYSQLVSMTPPATPRPANEQPGGGSSEARHESHGMIEGGLDKQGELYYIKQRLKPWSCRTPRFSCARSLTVCVL